MFNLLQSCIGIGEDNIEKSTTALLCKCYEVIQSRTEIERFWFEWFRIVHRLPFVKRPRDWTHQSDESPFWKRHQITRKKKLKFQLAQHSLGTFENCFSWFHCTNRGIKKRIKFPLSKIGSTFVGLFTCHHSLNDHRSGKNIFRLRWECE